MSSLGSEGSNTQTQGQTPSLFPSDPRTRSKYYERIINASANTSSSSDSGSSIVTLCVISPPLSDPRLQSSSNKHQPPSTSTSAVSPRQRLNSLNSQLPPINSSSSSSNQPNSKSSTSGSGSGRTKETDVRKDSENSHKKPSQHRRTARSPSPPKRSSPTPNLRISVDWIGKHRLGISTMRLPDGALKALLRIKGLTASNNRVEFDSAMYDSVRRTLLLFRPPVLLRPAANPRNYPSRKVLRRSKDYGDNEKSARTSTSRVPITAPRSTFSKSVSPPNGTILCEPYLEFYSFKEIHLSIEAIQLLKKKGNELSIYSANCGSGRFWYFSPDHYSKISYALSKLAYPIKLILQPKEPEGSTRKTNQNQTDAGTVPWSWGTPTNLPNTENTVGSNLTNSTTNASTATLPDSKTDIPGYEFEKYLCLPLTLKNLAGIKGIFYCQDQISISTFDALQVFSYKSNQKIILRLIAVDKLGHSTLGEKNGFLIQHVKCCGNHVPFPTRKATSFSIDLTKLFRSASLVDVTAKFEDLNENQISQSILYYVCIARKLSVEEMLQSLKLKDPIPIQKTRTMVTDSLKEAEKDGILTDDSKLAVSLRCPLGKTLMALPCKGVQCDHYACFDALNFLELYEKALNWKCPICDLALEYEDLRIDSFFDVILKSIGEEANNYDIKLDAAGNFDLVPIKQPDPDIRPPGTFTVDVVVVVE